MNMTGLLLAIVAGFVFIVASDLLIHEVWLHADYQATIQLWRPEAQMQQHIAWMFVGQLICATAFAVIWAKGFGGGSLGTGACVGFFIGLAQQVWAIVLFVILPMPGALAMKWFFAGLMQAILLGIVLALVYKPAASRT